MRNTGKKISLLLLLVIGIGLTGCNTNEPDGSKDAEELVQAGETPPRSTAGEYDSMDTVAIKSIDPEVQTITVANIELNKSYTLDYDGTTVIKDKYDNSMSMAQVHPGDIAEVYFLKNAKKMVNLRISPDAFVFEDIDRYSLNGERGSAVIGSEAYQLSKGALIISEEQEIGVADIVSRDTVTVKGIGRRIFSVVVVKGHGYLRLNDDAQVIGGWIEVGQAVIQRITDGMLLTVPEGNVNVRITSRGVDTTRKVFIERNKETVVDLSNLEIEQPKSGQLHLSITPEHAAVYLDGELINAGVTAEIEYGLHQIICEAEGYDTVSQYIKVSQEIASVTIAMDESTGSGTGTENESASGSSGSDSVSGNSLSAGSYLVYIDAPGDVEVYQDGVYMGVSPVRFVKVAGSHTITLRKSGYVTRSYTVQIDNDQQNVSYSFGDLERNTAGEGGSSSGSGNSGSKVSGNN